ncbi:SRPBCC domain-containing protein [Chitinophaga sp. RAB17]|uniref:SRPBCC domain-containing protein n=1 Tax=Chitinophaga sp. RAB17 TaxID=3233049 RepID=UPI003F8FB231
MDKPVIKKEININASTKNVWRVFTEPAVTRQMGGEYVSEWKVGSLFGWKGKGSTLYTNGTILALEPEKLLKHSLVDLKDKNKLLSVITYEFLKNGSGTIISAIEEVNYEMTDYQLKEANEGWDATLQLVKYVAEKL